MTKSKKNSDDEPLSAAGLEDNSAPVVVQLEIMDRPTAEPPAKKEQPAVDLQMTVMEKPGPERNLKDGAPKANTTFVTTQMQPRRKKKGPVRSIGSTYPQGRKR